MNIHWQIVKASRVLWKVAVLLSAGIRSQSGGINLA